MDIAVYDSRGRKLHGFDLDRDFVVSFDDGIWWYISLDDPLLIGARIDKVRDSENGRYNRYIIFGRLCNKETNVINAFKQLILNIKNYFDENGLIWEENVGNLSHTINDETIDNIETILKKIFTTLAIKQKVEVPVDNEYCGGCSISERIKVLQLAQKIIDYFGDYAYRYKLRLAYGYSELDAHIWFNPNKRDNLVLCEDVLSLI